MRILGIDPGSVHTGFGLVEVAPGDRLLHLEHGCIHLKGMEFVDRIGMLFDEMDAVVRRLAPDAVAMEKVFMARNADSALKLGQARGVALAAVRARHLPVFEYSALQVKQATVGAGRAQKEQVQRMVQWLLRLPAVPQTDAADALACAICHAHTAGTQARWMEAGGR